jgi:hypothetical protein
MDETDFVALTRGNKKCLDQLFMDVKHTQRD